MAMREPEERPLPPSAPHAHTADRTDIMTAQSPLLLRRHQQGCIDIDHTLHTIETYQNRAIWTARIFAASLFALIQYHLVPGATWSYFALYMLSSMNPFTITMFSTLVRVITRYMVHSGLNLSNPDPGGREVLIVPQLRVEDLDAAGVTPWSDHKEAMVAWWRGVSQG